MEEMGNIRKWLEAEVEKHGEPIESVVVGEHDSRRWSDALVGENVVLPTDAALAKLDLDFDDGFGAADCFPVYAWTKSRVYFIKEYDGATGLAWVPRNPVDISPSFSGESA